MRIATPVTDYIPASILTTLNDLVIRGAADPERYGQLSYVNASRVSVQSIPDATWTQFIFNQPHDDTNAEYNYTTGIFTPNRDKYIFVSTGVKVVGLVDTNIVGIRIYKNAVLSAERLNILGAAGDVGVHASCNMLITTLQTLTVEVYQFSGGALNTDDTVGTNWLSIIEIPIVP